MDQVPIPDRLRRFILLAIPSVPYLEAVLLLRGDPQKLWDRNEILQRLYLNDTAAQSLLADLKAGGILVNDTHEPACYRYQPRTAELQEMLDLLSAVYPKNLVGVTNLIHSKVNRQAQLFADAFLLRKGK
ncbi:MAG: hypothetical protein ACYC4K_00895 [Thiobacillus sp.]